MSASIRSQSANGEDDDVQSANGEDDDVMDDAGGNIKPHLKTAAHILQGKLPPTRRKVLTPGQLFEQRIDWSL